MSENTTEISSRPALADRFQIIDTLGTGAGSSVYLVADAKRNGEHVALKVLQNKEAFDEHTLRRFTNELEACREIRHPNLVEAYDLIQLGDTVAFTMEYVRGADLAAIFHQADRPSPQEIDRIFLEILSALEQLHLRGIVHRDLKLENILLREDGTVKLSDLGLMKRTDAEGLTRPGILLGTVHYMPPEYIKHGQYTEQSDIYGVAIMLLEIITGKRRLEGFDGREVIAELVRTRFEISSALLQTLPRKYRTIIERGAARDTKKRYQTVAEMRADFETPHSEFIGQVSAEMAPQLRVKSVATRCGILSEMPKRILSPIALLAGAGFVLFVLWALVLRV